MRRWLRRRPLPHAVPNQAATPSATASTASDASELLRRLEWTVLKRLDGALQGDYRSLVRGVGLDLSDLREYQPHDDVRDIDWNVTARLQIPHVRVFTEDREMTSWFLLDLSASVDFGSGTRSKREVLRQFTAVLARLLTRRGNRIGAILYGDGIERVIPPRASRQHVLQLLHAVGSPPPIPSAAATTRLADLLTAADTLIRRRSTIFVVSDFMSTPGWDQPLGRLALRHEVIAVRLLDPLEQQLPDLGLLTLRDMESGDEILVDTHDPQFRQRFAQAAAAHEDTLRQQLARAGVDALELSTADDLTGAIVRFVELRRRHARTATGRWPAHLRQSA